MTQPDLYHLTRRISEARQHVVNMMPNPPESDIRGTMALADILGALQRASDLAWELHDELCDVREPIP